MENQMKEQETQQPASGIAILLEALTVIFSMTVAKRIICAVLLVYNVSVTQAAAFSGVCDKSARKYRDILKSGDATALLRIAPGGKEGKLESIKTQLIEELDSGLYRTRRQIRLKVEERFGIKISLSGLSDFLKRNGYRKLCCASLPAKAKPAEQRNFYCDVLLRLMYAAKKNDLVLLFMDAAHFVYGTPTPGAIWGKTRRSLKTASGRMRHNVLAAIDFLTKKVTTICNDTYITADEVKCMLEKLAAYYVNKTICIVLDNARYQHCTAVIEYAQRLKIFLVFLPSYSPNLNLIERYWKYLKGEVLDASYQETFAKYKETIHSCIDSTCSSGSRVLDSLITYRVQLYDDYGNHLPFDNLLSHHPS
jgi:transposase